MDDDDVEMEVIMFKGEFCGSCLRCHEPSTGSFDSDENEKILKMRCVNCGFKSHLRIEIEERISSFIICGGD